ncbi:fumarylacetoacetate hydrolase family protein [Pontibacter saemangeumensis]|uniref:Fumarylacetoacetate hydrolase family protein n=1 Tax=Pontibacter saemangeumensis TaxID=1084525 RepID=A0ABP8M370_9BACT
MKLYRTQEGILIEKDKALYPVRGQQWDEFLNDDRLYEKMQEVTQNVAPDPDAGVLLQNLLAPVQSQEIWASGVTYFRSKEGRQEESKGSGGGEFYAMVYEAERPELFFKSTAYRAVGPGGNVRIRRDSTWDVPEPELTLVITSSGRIVGYTIGNDMSSRSIEGENPLYLPQAKTYDGSAAVGPCIYVTKDPLPSDTLIQLEILRRGEKVFEGAIEIAQMKRKPEELVSYLYRECSFPHGSLLMTGTGIVPESDFTLQQGDEVRITIGPIGTLVNYVQ